MARSARLESGFQDRLIKRIKALLPGCFVFKMDQVQGIPDLLILFGGRWASLERCPFRGSYILRMLARCSVSFMNL